MRRRRKQRKKSYVKFRETPELVRIHQRLAKSLGLLRRRQGLSKKALAAKMETSRPLVVRMEQGKARPTIKTLHRAARVLGAHLEVRLVPREERARKRRSR
jgi:ribosome-binding protein aMBF1 (putative translation factor)